MKKMFCYQCQETALGRGCTVAGVCGKTAEVADLQDRLIYATEALCAVATALRKEGKSVSSEASRFITTNLFMTVTNTDFDRDDFRRRIKETLLKHTELLKLLDSRSDVHSKALIKEGIEKAKAGILDTEDENIRSLYSIVTLGIKGLAAYLTHAAALGYQDDRIDTFLQDALTDVFSDNLTKNELVQLVIQTGHWGVEAMALLDKANTESYGNPVISEVTTSVNTDRPGILVSGHDLKDLEELLEQTAGTVIVIYTHGEMLPAHYYPKLKKHRHLHGNYGGAWWEQKKEFDLFNGPVILTSNCLVPPKESYRNRIYTTGPVGYPGCPRIYTDENGSKDFSAVIGHALKCPPPGEIDNKIITGGFAHHQLEELFEELIEGIKSGAIGEFVVMAGCDGRMHSREYYTDFARELPANSVILTAGCAKYRYNKLNLGTITLPSGRSIPRILDAGQCNDSYSLAVIATKLRSELNLNSINELPIVYNIAWYEQKAVIVLLALLSLGIKDIHLGPTLPGFISTDIMEYLIMQYRLAEKI